MMQELTAETDCYIGTRNIFEQFLCDVKFQPPINKILFLIFIIGLIVLIVFLLNRAKRK